MTPVFTMLPVAPMHLRRIIAALVMTVACSSDVTPPGGRDDDNDNNNGALTSERRMTALAAINDKAHALTGASIDARRQELLTYLLSRAEIASAGVSVDGSLWALFTDNRPLIIVANQEDDIAADMLPDDVSRVLTSSPPELPNSVQAVVMLGGDKRVGDAKNEEIKAMLRQRNYVVSGSFATLDDLKSLVKNVGVFYLRGHGGYGFTPARDSSWYAVLSATPVSIENDLKYAADWDNGRITYQFRLTGSYRPGINAQRGTYYGFNVRFVKEYFRFDPGSVVYMSTCFGDGPQTEFKNEFLAQGAGGYWSYDGTFKDGFDNYTAQLVFDRLLGLNEYDAESPKQRPFGSASIKRWLAKEKLDFTDGQGAVELTFTPGTINQTGALAPSIEYMTMDESSNILYLKGQFGVEMSGRAEVNGSSNGVTVKKWEKEEIQLQIPLTGDQSAGDVKVFSRNRESNPRTLTQWRIPFKLSFSPGTHTLKWEGPIRAHIRADVQDYREEAGQTPVYGRFDGVPIQLARDTDGDLTGSGDNGQPGLSKMFWEGTSHLESRTGNPLSPNPIDGIGVIDPEFKVMKLFLAVSSTQGMFARQNATLIVLPAAWGYPGDGPMSLTNPLPAMYLPLANDFSVTGDQRTLPVSPAPVLSWLNHAPAHKPLNETAR